MKLYDVFFLQCLSKPDAAAIDVEHHAGRFESLEAAITIAVALSREGHDGVIVRRVPDPVRRTDLS